MTTLSRMDSLVCRLITHGSWSGWGLQRMDPVPDPVADPRRCAPTTMRCMLDDIQSQRSASVCSQPPWDGVRYAGIGGRPSRFLGHGYRRAGAVCSPCFHTHGGYGPMAPSTRHWWASSGLHPSGPSVYRISYLYAVSVRLAASSLPAERENSFRVYDHVHCRYGAGC